ncbi:hypothetical protein K449DRAFT_402300 [Hypoxylon sp. EC38]|nr:hypothetical protein K449DRAFT_402300 [Hypoxylon sp. EC38]
MERHHHHHSNRPNFPPYQPGQPGYPGLPAPPAPRTAPHPQPSSDRVLSSFLNNLQALKIAPESVQRYKVTKLFRGINVEIRRSDIKHTLEWMLKRMQLFQSLPTADQSRYLQEVIEWRRIHFAPNPHTDYEYTAYLLPGIAHYVRTIRTGTFDAKRDGNWFVWFKKGLTQRHVEEGFMPMDDEKADRQLLEHMIQYEADRGGFNVSPRQPDDPLALPPISEILRPRNNFY